MNTSSILKLGTNTYIKEIPKIIKSTLYLVIKRLFDLFASTIGIIILLPVFIIIIFLIKKEDKGSAFFTQERIGKNGKLFRLYKFRSMVHNADDILYEMLKDPEISREYKKNMKLPNDPRITKIGKFIRKTSLDELPQLINVFLGHMCLIGNRPYLPREKEDMEEHFSSIVKCKPGVTGFWQIHGRSNTTFEDRLKMDTTYSYTKTLKNDIKILLKTVKHVVSKEGAI